MGAGMSNPFDEASRERVQEIITEVMTVFTSSFLVSCELLRRTPRRRAGSPRACALPHPWLTASRARCGSRAQSRRA